MNSTFHAGDIISTMLFLLFAFLIIGAIIIFFKRVSDGAKQQKEISAKLDTLIELLKNKQ
ncbi:DUF4083 family protein [Metasolibacillus meyeri]|uniref:DUF4083 family protein n=1 Tax=Metasolibacillus meyeri TaxID=1071052 RepID=UPI00187D34EA|nr:DUF4083 family protein [Metasolibacillus meyeri]